MRRAATPTVSLSTLYPTPYTLHPAPHTLHDTPYTLHPTPYTLHYTPSTLHPAPCTLFVWSDQHATCRYADGTPSTLNPTPYTLHYTPSTLHPSLYTLHPTTYTLQTTHYILHPIPCSCSRTSMRRAATLTVSPSTLLPNSQDLTLKLLKVKASNVQSRLKQSGCLLVVDWSRWLFVGACPLACPSLKVSMQIPEDPSAWS